MNLGKKIILTSGYNGAKNVILMAELLKREGVHIEGIMVVSEFSLRRLVKEFRKKGVSFIIKAFSRIFRSSTLSSDTMLNNFMQSEGLSSFTCKSWCEKNGSFCNFYDSINSKKLISDLSHLSPSLVIYGGGGILSDAFIHAANNKVLNAHCGPLPEVRGMSAAEWAVLSKQRSVTTIHFIDSGIDTGNIIAEYPYSVESGDTVDTIRSKSVIAGIKGMVDVIVNAKYENGKPGSSDSPQYYSMSWVMQEVLRKSILESL